MKSANDLTQGVIWKQLVKYSLPLIATSVMQSLYSLFDILIAGRFLGSAGISGINNSSQVLGIVNTVVIGLSMGGTILIGRLFGQGEKSKMQNASNTFINSFFIMGIIMSVVLYFVSPMIITLMKTPAYNEAVSYFKVCAIGVFFTFCYNALSGVMRAVGNSKMPMYCIFVSTTVNIVLDIIFMGVIKLGTAGAALATVIAQGISFFMALGFVLKQKDMWTSLKIYGNVLGKIIKIGFPCAVQMTVAGISFIVVTYTINTYGVAASAGSAISMKLRDIPFLVVSTMSNAASAMVAQNLGAGLYERSEKIMYTAMGMTLGITSVLIIIMEIFVPYLAGLFTEDTEAIYYAVLNIRIEVIGQLFYSVFMIQHSLATGAGHTLFVLCNSFVNCIIFRLVLTIVFNMFFGIVGVFIACAVAPSVSIPIGHWYVSTKKWQYGFRKKSIREGAV